MWDDKPPHSKFGRDKDFVVKDVFIEDGKRKVPRGDPDDKDSKAFMRKSSMASGLLDADQPNRRYSWVDIDDSSLFEVDLNYTGLVFIFDLFASVCVRPRWEAGWVFFFSPRSPPLVWNLRAFSFDAI